MDDIVADGDTSVRVRLHEGDGGETLGDGGEANGVRVRRDVCEETQT